MSELWSEERVRDRATPIHSKHALCSVVEKSNHTITTTVSKLNFNCVCIKIAVVGIGGVTRLGRPRLRIMDHHLGTSYVAAYTTALL